MAKVYITRLLFRTAMDLSGLAREAKERGLIDKEVRMSMAVHLMAALCLEGAANEAGETKLEAWFWSWVERLEPSAKWFVLSQLLGGGQFVPGREPLQTVGELQSVRNRIAHPKGWPEASEVIVRHEDGRIEKDPPGGALVAQGDFIYKGYARAWDEFNAGTAERMVDRVRIALELLRQSVYPEGLEWLGQEPEYEW